MKSTAPLQISLVITLSAKHASIQHGIFHLSSTILFRHNVLKLLKSRIDSSLYPIFALQEDLSHLIIYCYYSVVIYTHFQSGLTKFYSHIFSTCWRSYFTFRPIQISIRKSLVTYLIVSCFVSNIGLQVHTYQLFGSVSVKYELISIEIGSHVLKSN